jgi:hypothetical protein
MTGELPSDPYCAKRLKEENFRRDEEAFFEVWFQLQRHQDWERKYPGEPFHENWGMASHDAMLQGWMARAGLHVSYARKPRDEHGT